MNKEQSFTIKIAHDHPIILREPIGLDEREKMIYDGRLLIQPNAIEKLKKHIEWGEKSFANIVEQAGWLIGRVYQYGNIIYGVVEEIIEAETDGTPVSVFVGVDQWILMHERLEELNSKLSIPYVIVGWYHTHPGRLAVYMSDQDMSIQRKFFYMDYHFALVLNPQKRLAKSFQGKDGQNCQLMFMENEIITEEDCFIPDVEETKKSNIDCYSDIESQLREFVCRNADIVKLQKIETNRQNQLVIELVFYDTFYIYDERKKEEYTTKDSLVLQMVFSEKGCLVKVEAIEDIPFYPNFSLSNKLWNRSFDRKCTLKEIVKQLWGDLHFQGNYQKEEIVNQKAMELLYRIPDVKNCDFYVIK